MEIFSREELMGLTKKQLKNLAAYYGVDTALKGEELIDALLLAINPKSPTVIEGDGNVEMSERVKRIYGGG